jgi:hypothetical protein
MYPISERGIAKLNRIPTPNGALAVKGQHPLPKETFEQQL